MKQTEIRLIGEKLYTESYKGVSTEKFKELPNYELTAAIVTLGEPKWEHILVMFADLLNMMGSSNSLNGRVWRIEIKDLTETFSESVVKISDKEWWGKVSESKKGWVESSG